MKGLGIINYTFLFLSLALMSLIHVQAQDNIKNTNSIMNSTQTTPTNTQTSSTLTGTPDIGKDGGTLANLVPKLKNRSLMGYFHTQSQTPIDARINVTNVSPRLTHTIFAFAKVMGNTSECVVTDEFFDTKDSTALPLVKLGNNGNSTCTQDKRGAGNLAALFALKKDNPHMRILMSIGGANDQSKKNFTLATSTADRISHLATSCVKLAFDYGLDGIDYDWEYPSNLKEWDNFSSLLKKTREVMNTYQFKSRYLISVALLPSAFTSNDSMQAIPKIASEVDFLNLMTYDASPGSDRALHNSPLYSSAESYGAMSINDTVTSALQHFSPNKIMVGQPLYGILMTTKPKTRVTSPSSNRGLFEAVDTSQKTAANNASPLDAFTPVFYNTIRDSYLTNDNFTRYWDDTSKATWIYNNQTKEFLTYSDETSISAVLDYVEQRDLGGVFFWQLGGSFNKKSSREELIEFTASKMSVDYTKRAVCAPQSPFCNIKSECPSNMAPDGLISSSTSLGSSFNTWSVLFSLAFSSFITVQLILSF